MNSEQRLAQRQKLPFGTNRIRNRIGKFWQNVEDHANRAGNLPGGNRAGRRVDRDGRRCPFLGQFAIDRSVLVKQFVIGVRQLTRTTKFGDLAREDSTRAGSQISCSPRLVEERQRKPTGSVRDDDFEQRALTPVHRTIVHTHDLGNNCDRFVEGKCVKTGELTAFRISARVMAE